MNSSFFFFLFYSEKCTTSTCSRASSTTTPTTTRACRPIVSCSSTSNSHRRFTFAKVLSLSSVSFLARSLFLSLLFHLPTDYIFVFGCFCCCLSIAQLRHSIFKCYALLAILYIYSYLSSRHACSESRLGKYKLELERKRRRHEQQSN